VPDRTDTDLLAELTGIASENWGEHIGEHTITPLDRSMLRRYVSRRHDGRVDGLGFGAWS
jgi:hypothetical protein